MTADFRKAQKPGNYPIVINQPRLDYLTITSYRDEIYVASSELAAKFDSHERKSLGNYEGWYVELPSLGSAFVGWGSQRNMAHNLIQLHGNTAHAALQWVRDNFLYPEDKCNRMDIQITCIEPDYFEPFELAARLNDAGRTVNFLKNARGATVYIGSRSSERFCRVYQKQDAEGKKLLRLEAEMSGQRSNEHMRILSQGVGDVMIGLVAALRKYAEMDGVLSGTFLDHLNGDTKPIHLKSANRKTEDWLRRVVAPALAKYCNDHNSEPSLIELLQRSTNRRM